jgi:hypothetical protein
MLLVIFGAGASYDSAPSRPPLESRYRDLPNRPPLASELFSDRQHFGEVMNKYPECLPIIPQLRHPPTQSTVEAELQRLQLEAVSYPSRNKQLAAIRYYLQEILWTTGHNWLNETQNVGNYRTLIDRIKRWKPSHERVCFVTFNYDWLLDKALREEGYPFDKLSAYVARDLMLVKLHGSVNWGRIVRVPNPQDIAGKNKRDLAHHLIAHFSELEISREYVVTGEYPPAPRQDCAVFPALAIPVETKLDFECPPEHVEALTAFITGVTRILIIGWRATEQPFLDLLKEGLGRASPLVMAVNGRKEDSERALETIGRAGIRGKSRMPEHNEYGFTEFIRNHGEDEFLHSS